MQKTTNPSLKISSLGEPVVIPQKLKRSIATWANVEYHRYNFGHILTQTLLYKLFRIYILRFRMKQAAFVQLYRRRGAICMFCCLNGSLQIMLPEIPALSIQKDQFGFAYLPEGARLLQPVAETELFIVELEAPMLEELAASRKEFKELVDLATVNDSTARILPLLPMNHMIHHILEDMRLCKQSRGNLLMELKTANLQLINLYRKVLNENENFKKLPTQSNLEGLPGDQATA
ncbi:hypothetical protein SAMN04488505_104251 [Chitinophaga rupis]|uniref:Uncharacterized protein n=1 Tax=Chitinophaga rupis TaxID=573321 RepID=A0A1H7Y0T8_9BACT|nr:hypothetical protein [Chitinophaga rupis]SEM38958.1 hypothetical protein SAMN04488505_104251 [Chitinophaga rupis]